LTIFHLWDTFLKYIQNLRGQEEPVSIERLSKLIFSVSLFSCAWTGATGDILSVSHAYVSLFPMASVPDAPSVAAGIALNYSTFADGIAREATRQPVSSSPVAAVACKRMLGGTFYFNFPLYQAFLLA
jgi:hypothetical protein